VKGKVGSHAITALWHGQALTGVCLPGHGLLAFLPSGQARHLSIARLDYRPLANLRARGLSRHPLLEVPHPRMAQRILLADRHERDHRIRHEAHPHGQGTPLVDRVQDFPGREAHPGQEQPDQRAAQGAHSKRVDWPSRRTRWIGPINAVAVHRRAAPFRSRRDQRSKLDTLPAHLT